MKSTHKPTPGFEKGGVNFTKKAYHKEKVTAIENISLTMFSEAEFTQGQTTIDCMRESLTFQLKAYIYAHSQGTQEITFYPPKPKFFDWLFGRSKRVVIKINCKEYLNPVPTINKGLDYLYFAEIKEPEI